MSIRMLSRCGAVLLFATVATGCSTGGGTPQAGARATMPDIVCLWNRSKCMYEGPYEPGEEAYAEREAARLNRAEAAKLRRSAGW